MIIDNSSSEDVFLANSVIDGATTLDGDRWSIANCKFRGGLTLAGTCSDFQFVNCQFGADAGSGSNTLTINSGALRTSLSNSRADAAIVDNGTDSSTDYILY